jgi:hypothetical protein
MANWMETDLWRLLQERGESAAQTMNYVRTWLDDVETLLAKAGTAPLDFSLHDDDHSYRVAQRMAELIPSDSLHKLSNFELGLLLLSAYLHDIGMNPRRQVVRQIRDYLFTGDIGDLPASEADLLQRWLDESSPGTQPPIDKGEPEQKRIYRAEWLTAYFCRFRHNAWSENFIVEKSTALGHPPYPTWVQDLVTLCKSHHYNLPALINDEFNLRIAGGSGDLVNLRYLAALLRVADVMDFDPERTPEVVFAQRSIDHASIIYWYKDHDIVLALNKPGSKVLMTARSPDAWIHRAILDTADAVDWELRTCEIMHSQNDFCRGIGVGQVDHYKWPWPSRVTRDIRPRPNSFEYIDGAFRPDTQRIVALLAGTRLYHNPLVALRELLQNAFDAVKEQIALELLQSFGLIGPVEQSAQAQVHRVSVSLEERDGDLWLVCSDTGVGMTRRVIENYLLVSGSRPRPELLALQRHYEAKGARLERSGEFGIGVLSYFMLADKMVIETRASEEAYSEREMNGWRFETEGINAFGELRRISRTQRGSLVKLRIREEQRKNLAEKSI